jgi:uncharacterized FlaG/YvyC family protein
MEENRIEKYTCSSVKDKLVEWMESFKKDNACTETDRRFMEYEKSILEFIIKCKEFDLAKFMESIPKQDKIRVAKTIRELGYSPWDAAMKVDK